MTLQELKAELDRLDKGLLLSGSHTPGGDKFCALEFESQVRGRDWSDRPITLPDLRPINDGLWSSDMVRTEALLPVMVALWNWSEWSDEKKQAWVVKVVVLLVQRTISKLPNLSESIREQCRNANDLDKARAAAYDARAARAAAYAARAADAAAYAADAAADAATYAADAAAYAARAVADAADVVLREVCEIWIEATKE